MDFGSESHDEDTSEEEPETFGIKWSHKLERIEPKKFKGPKPGAIKHLSETANPLNYLFEIFPENMFSLMAKSSNSPKPCVDDYWSANPALGNQTIIQLCQRDGSSPSKDTFMLMTQQKTQL